MSDNGSFEALVEVLSDSASNEDNARTCKKCGEVKPSDQFRVDKRGYIRSACRLCEVSYNTQWLKNHPETKRAQGSRYYDRHKEQINTYAKQWAAKHPEQRKETERRSRAKYQERDRLRKLNWRHNNPGKAREMGNRRRAKELSAPGDYTASEWRRMCQFYDYRCVCCGERKPLEADHVTPLSKGGSNHISNLQPLCRSCNSKKATQTIDYRATAYKQEVLL